MSRAVLEVREKEVLIEHGVPRPVAHHRREAF